jgi:hypothetical protein
MTAQKERERFIPVAKSQLIEDLAHSDWVAENERDHFFLIL